MLPDDGRITAPAQRGGDSGNTEGIGGREAMKVARSNSCIFKLVGM